MITNGFFAKLNTDGTYGKICDTEIKDLTLSSNGNDLVTVPEEDRCIICEPQIYSGTFTLSKSIPMTMILNDTYTLINGCCCNCGAPVKGDYCEYCGTSYKREFKTEMVIRKE